MDELRGATKVYIAALAALAVALVLGSLRTMGPIDGRAALIALAVAVATALAWLFPIPFASKTQIYVDTAVTVAAILLLPPALAALAVGAGALTAHLIRYGARDVSQTVFNTAQAALLTMVGALLLSAVGWDPAQHALGNPAILLALLVVAAVMHLLNVVLVAVIPALQAGLPLLDTVRRALAEEPRTEAAAQVALVASGVLAALVVETALWGAALLAVPVAAVHVTLRRQAELRQQAEEARLMSDAGLAEAQRLAHLGSWEWRPPTTQLVWSDETYRLFGFAPRAVAPTYPLFLDGIDPDDRDVVDRAMRDAYRAQVPVRIEFRVAAPDGSARLLQMRGEPRPDGEPGIVHFVGTMQDVTERAQAEAAMRRAKEVAEQADRAKSRVLSMASHDLRTPLTSISGYVDLLLHGGAGPLTDDQRELLGVVQASSGHLIELVNDLLDLARIEAGRLDLNTRPISLDPVLDGICDVLGPVAAAKGIRLEVDAPDDDPLVLADPDRLYQVLLNLTSNAVKFTEQGGVRIVVRPAGHAVEVVVEDTGTGISPEFLPRLFQEFSQDGEVARRQGGTGLGLAITRRLVELQGGTIAAHSELGRGSAFSVRLPAAGSSAEDVPPHRDGDWPPDG